MARSISKSLRPGLPPCDGICRIPSSALCVRLVRPCDASLLQAFLSPIFGAPFAPVPWQAPHTVATTSLPLRASPAAIACGCIINSAIAPATLPDSSQRGFRMSDEALSQRPLSMINIACSSHSRDHETQLVQISWRYNRRGRLQLVRITYHVKNPPRLGFDGRHRNLLQRYDPPQDRLDIRGRLDLLERQ